MEKGEKIAANIKTDRKAKVSLPAFDKLKTSSRTKGGQPRFPKEVRATPPVFERREVTGKETGTWFMEGKRTC
jgi:hypothetical protein